MCAEVIKNVSIPDGRKLRSTGRIESFSTKLLPGTKEKLFLISKLKRKKYNQVIEDSLDLYLSQLR